MAWCAGCSFTPSGSAGDGGGEAGAVIDAPIDARPCGAGYVDGFRYLATHGLWLDAERDCEGDGGHLAVLATPAQRTAAVAAAQAAGAEPALWVGLVRDANTVGPPWPWRWVDGTPVVEPLGWSGGQPDNGGDGTQYVIRMDRDSGQLYDRDYTDASLPALCQCDGRAPVNADYDPATP